ncbi:MAG: HAD hydrolase family protein [Phycisphaeraceae bacterium]|nr:HAD hydrolase family protein [Phycisphaeraceae bacterium]
MRRYDMLAIDLDGTLLDPAGRVSARNAEAIVRAREAGMAVTVCTGRGLAESLFALHAIGQEEPVVVAGGSMIACPCTGATLLRFPMHATLSSRLVDAILHHGHAALVLKDRHAAGYDYLVVTGEKQHPLDPTTQWWFETMRVNVRLARSIAEDEHPDHTVRVGVCARPAALEGVEAVVRAEFGGLVCYHNFPAVVDAEKATDTNAVHILELFDARADKWSAIRHVAGERGIDASRICAIGDQVNDLTMIRGAGLGVAMGNAIPDVRAAAGRITRSNGEDGVAWAVERVLGGEW